MISSTEARRLIFENCNPTKVDTIELSEANGCILAEPVLSVIDTPPFHQSAMDGYAFSYENWDKKTGLTINGENQTGNYTDIPLPVKAALRIYTGAAIPVGSDTVVIQEKVIKHGHTITIQDEHLEKGSNVRLQGSQTKRGETALQKGHLLTPAGISFLAGIGVSKVKVFAKPSVSIIATGKELIKAGDTITEGKIFESNSIGLVTALQQLNIKPANVEVVDDDEDEIRKVISSQMIFDILIITGGVSVGDYDLVPSSLEKCGVEKIFHKVRQKPGKPFYFGRYRNTLVFALPGNPSAVMSCYYEYVVPVIGMFTHKIYFKKILLPLANDFYKKPGLTYFLKGKTTDQNVNILDNQESYLMNSFAIADCLVELEEEREYFKKGDLVNIMMIV